MALRISLVCLLIPAVVVVWPSASAAQGAAQNPPQEARPTTKPASAKVAPGAAALAEQYAQLAQMAVSTRPITPETLRQSIDLLKAAHRLNPEELRFARLLGEAALQAGDSQTALDAYTVVSRLDPNDRVAQIRLIDLYSARMESADARLRYLVGDGESRKGIYNSERVPAEVRSHAAVLACQIYFERAQTTDAIEMLEEALRLFPLSPDALKLKYQLDGESGTPRQRVALLLQMLRSNPSQPGVMAKLGQELADVGLHEPSLTWYNAAISLAQRVGRGVSSSDFDRYAAQLIITGNAAMAQQLAKGLLESNPADVDAAFINVIVHRRGGDEENLKQALTQAERALLTRAVVMGRQLRGEDANLEAMDSVQVDVPGDIKLLLEQGDARLINAYASTLSDLAWLRVYFQQNAQEAAQVIDQLRQLLPADSITLARLEGWTFLVAGQVQEARVKLSAVADRDPLAALGMIRLIEADQPDRATAEARRLMDETPSGLLGAVIHDALRDKKLKLPAGQTSLLSPDGQQVKAELDQFPSEWLDFIDKPSRFYLIRAEPLKVSHQYGEPIIARIVVRNIGHHDITVGPDGAIRPDVWFDAQIRGAFNDFVQGVAFDRLTQHAVLKRGQSIEQTIRVDQDRLLQILQTNASATLPLYYSFFTNPITTSTHIGPGPGGQRQQFLRPIQRVGVSVERKYFQNTLTQTLSDLSTGPVETKLRALQVLGWLAHQLSQTQEDEQRAMADHVMSAIHRSMNDPDPHVRAGAGLVMTRPGVVRDEQRRRRLIEEMLDDPSWEPRMLGLLLVQSLEPGQWRELTEPLASSDPDPLLRSFAQAVTDFAQNPAATQPVTPPAEGEPVLSPTNDEPTTPVATP